MTDVKASSPPQLPPPTVKTRVCLNGSKERARRMHVTRSIVYCSASVASANTNIYFDNRIFDNRLTSLVSGIGIGCISGIVLTLLFWHAFSQKWLDLCCLIYCYVKNLNYLM